MKIQGWSVERFGALRNYEVRDLPAGLTVFCGPNGSGKSTLVAFIKQMLFSQRPAFAHEGWSGRLYVSGPAGVYTIAQRPDRQNEIGVTRPDGTDASETEIEQLFGGNEGRLVGSSLAFDIADLQTLPALSNSGVRERMFPAGAGRGLRAIQRALDTVQERKAEIGNRSDRDLQTLTVSASDLQTRIDRSTRAAVRLGQLLQSHAQAQGAFDLRTRTITDLRADVAKYETLVELSPVWQELTHARRELESLGSVEQFPPDPEQRLEQALAARQAAQRTVAQLVGRDGATPAAQTTVARPQAPRVPEPVTGTSEDLAGWQRRLNEAAEAARESEVEYENTSRTVRELEVARNELSAVLGRPEPPSTATLEEEARLVQHVRTTLAGLESDQTFTKRWQDQIAERSSAIRNLETQVITIPSLALTYLGWIAAVAGIGGVVWRYLAHDMIVMGAVAGASVLAAVGAALQHKRRNKSIEEEGDRRSQLDDARGELERACQSLLHHQERASRRQFDISVASVRLGLPQMPTDLQLKEREAEVEAQRLHRAEWDKAQATFEEHKSTLTKNEELRRQKAQAMMAAQAHERQTIQQWNQWKVHGQSDSVMGQRPVADSTRSEAELLETCRRLRVQIAEWEQNATEWNTRARAALVGIAEPEAATAAGGTAVLIAEPVIDQASPALKAARRRLQHCEEALMQLFSQAGVSDEHAYRTRLATYRRRSTLTQMIRSCEARYNERLRREAAPDAVQRELNDGNVEEWRQRSTRSASELAELETARDEIMRQLRQLETDIASARSESSELPVLEAERAALATETLASVRAARALVVAGSLLEDTRRHIDRESQPPALRRASETLSAITFSRYERVGQSEDQRELTVLDTRSGWTPVTQLSRGTVDQLYFSLRVGLAAESEQRGARPPIVIDDVLDHFDPKRSQAMARQVVELSRKHQVFVFTRRPETSDLLRSLDPTVNLMTLQEL